MKVKYIRHGFRHSKIYKVWQGMKERCENPKHDCYKGYGGRGITFCDEWKNPHSFITWALNAGYKPGLQIDRIDVNGNYGPNNCRFVTNKVNCRNRRNTIYHTHQNVTKPLVEWAEIFNVDYSKAWHRLKLGWSFEKAMDRL